MSSRKSSSPAAQPVKSASESRGRRPISLGKRLLFAAATTLVVFALLEIVLWLTGVSTLIERDDPFRGFSGLVKVFERQGEIYRTAPAGARTFNDQSFLADKPANGLRIFCLGESSSYGFPWGGEAAFTSILGEALAAAHPERRIEAVNASGVSYAVHRLNIVEDELLTYQPDVFIIYSGNNEFVEPAFFEALKHRNPLRTRLEYFLAHSRIYSGLSFIFHQAGNPQHSGSLELEVQRDMARVYSPAEKEAIVAEYRWRLERLIRRAQQAGVKVVVCSLPCNQREWRPQASTTLAALSQADRQRWSEEIAASKQQLKAHALSEALPHLERAAQLAPGHAETQFLLAQTYDSQGRWDDARLAYQRACDADASPQRRLSSINDAIRDVTRSSGALLVDVDRVFAEKSDHELVGFNIIEDYVHPTRSGHEVIAWHIWDAMERAGWLGAKSSASRAQFEQILAARRNRPEHVNPVWLYNQGIVLQYQGQTAAAIKKYREALEISPNYEGALLNLSGALNNTGQYADAAPIAERLVRITPDNAEAHNNWGTALKNLGRTNEAIVCFQNAVQLKPGFALAHRNLGDAYLGRGEDRAAIEELEKALKLNPDDSDVQNDLGNALRHLGRIIDATRHYEEALRIDHDNAQAHNNLGNILQQTGRNSEAIKHYEEALRIRPKNADVHNNLANILVDVGRVPEGIHHYEEALRIQPENAAAHFNLAMALEQSGRSADAIKHYEDALRFNPQLAPARDRLSVLRAKNP